MISKEFKKLYDVVEIEPTPKENFAPGSVQLNAYCKATGNLIGSIFSLERQDAYRLLEKFKYETPSPVETL